MKKYIKRFKEYIYKDKRIFAQGHCKEKIFLMFVIGCLIGCFYEEILYMYDTYKSSGIAIYETRRGLLYGELSPVYGWGCIIMLLILLKRKRRFFDYFIYGSLIGGIYEYSMSFLQEKLTGAVSWDYSELFLNINGRTTIPFMLFWGLMAVLLVYVIYPVCSKLIESIPYNLGMLIYHTLVVLISIDFFVTYTAVIRQTLRRAGYQPFSIYGKFLDKYYPNERIAKAFVNAKFK